MRACATTSNSWPMPESCVRRSRPGPCPGPRWRATLAAGFGQTRPEPRGSPPRSRACRRRRGMRRAPATSTGRVALPAPNSRWRCGASATRRARRASCPAGVQYTGDRFAFRAQATAVADADDGKTYRPDGSYVAAVLGNWMLHAGYIDRWWGPGWEGSLISAAMRARSRRSRSSAIIPTRSTIRGCTGSASGASPRRWASSKGAATMRRTRSSSARASPGSRTRASRSALSRSAQWCGDGRPCGVDTFWDLLTGNDNDQPLEEQPGNQMAGFDARWSLPFAPVAVYGQMIGEDEAGFLPSKYLGLSASRSGAASATGPGGRTSSTRTRPAASTTANRNSAAPTGTSSTWTATSTTTARSATRSTATASSSRRVHAGARRREPGICGPGLDVNRESANPVHSVSPVAIRIESADLEHRRGLLGGDLRVSVGVERREGGADDGEQVRGFVRWVREFK